VEVVMNGARNERARARAQHLLALTHPIPHDAEVQRLRELALDYIREAERLEAEGAGRSCEPAELISAALDAVARNFFKRELERERRRVEGSKTSASR
jgi:hypothetical protein